MPNVLFRFFCSRVALKRVSVVALTGSLLIFASLSGCADAPEQYSTGFPIQVDRTKTSLPNDIRIELPKDPGVGQPKDDDALARANSLKPIVYGSGAAAVTFSTTFEQAQTGMSTPFYGPDSDGLAAYRSGVYVFWQLTSPRIPTLILITSDYQGALDVGGEFGQVKMNQAFEQWFTESDPNGHALAVKLFNTLEKKEGEFNCLDKKLCAVSVDDENITISWHKLALLLSKDRKVLYRLALDDATPQGQLANDFDFTTGAILIPGQKAVQLGDAWGETLNRIGVDARSSTSTNLFVKTFSGILLGVSRNEFGAEYSQPSDTEVLENISVYSGFNQKLRILGKPIALEREDGRLILRALSSNDRVNEETVYLDLRPQLKREDQLPFLDQLGKLVDQAWHSESSSIIKLTLASGVHAPGEDKTLRRQMIQWDLKNKNGKSVSFSLGTEDGNLNFVESSVLADSANAIILPGVAKTVSVSEKELAGFKLGDTLFLDEIDLLREEATAVLTPEVSTRADLIVDGSLSIVTPEGRKKTVQLAVIRVGDVRVSLGLQVAKIPETNAYRAKVVSISTAFQQTVRGFCGLEMAQVQPAEKDTRVKARLDEAIAEARKADASFSCSMLVETASTGTGLLSAIYFPDQGIKINFADREVSSVTLYSAEVQ